MAPPKLDFAKLVGQVPRHLGDMPSEAARPLDHYRYDAHGCWNLLRYFDRKTEDGNAGPRERHLLRLRSMIVLGLVEAFERFLKETAAACVDQLIGRVLDDRFAGLSSNVRAVVAHFPERTIGRALCESETWLDSTQVNARYTKLLADPFEPGSFKLFPEPANRRDPEIWRRTTIDTLWQLRHSIAHNSGVITRSDAAKLRLLCREQIDGPRRLELTNGDVWYIKLFLDDLSTWANRRIAARLADLLTKIHQDDNTLFSSSEVADELAQLFREGVTVGEDRGTPR